MKSIIGRRNSMTGLGEVPVVFKNWPLDGKVKELPPVRSLGPVP